MSEESRTFINEHEAAPEANASNADSYQPSDEERKTIRLVQKIYEENKKHRKIYDEKWLDRYKFFRGQQWKEHRPTYRHSEVINMIFQSIQSTVPIMTDSRPKVEFVPKEPADQELAEILNQVFECDWENGNWSHQLLESIYDSHLYSVGYTHIGYDPKADYGAGAITWESADPFYSFPAPSALDVNKRNRSFVYAEPIDVEDAHEDYPEKAKYIKADLMDLVGGNKAMNDQITYRSPVDARTMVESGEPLGNTQRNQVLKITCYLKSSETLEEKIESPNEQTGEMEEAYQSKLKYPNGRKIVLVGGVLCQDGPCPYDDGLFPYAKLLNYVLPREYYGMSEVEQLESPQKIFNKLVSFSLDVLTLMGNPVWIVDNDSEVDTDNLFNRPGLIIEKAKGSEVRREAGVELQPYVLQIIDRMRNWFDGISGANDVTRGVRPEGITAASAISELQEAAQTRIRLKSRNLDTHLKDGGRQWLSRCFQYYTAPRVFRVTHNENVNKYFKFYVEPALDPYGQPTDQKQAVVRQYSQDPATGQQVLSDPKTYLIQSTFDVRITTGSSLPFAKAQKVNLATTLFDRGAIDQLELLKAADYPNYEAVWQRVQEQRAKDAQAQAQLQAQAKGGGAPAQAPV
jgi:hypothetical protein